MARIAAAGSRRQSDIPDLGAGFAAIAPLSLQGASSGAITRAMAPDILCIGAVLWDVIGRPDPRVARPLPRGADVPGRIVRVPGGVALNVAVALRRMGLRPALLGAVGRDPDGGALVESCRAVGLIADHLHRTDGPTDRFVAIEDPDGVVAAVADTRSLEAAGARILEPLSDGRLARPWRGPVALDGNLTEALLGEIAGSEALSEADLRISPASPGKAARLRAVLGHPSAVLYLNVEEARVVAERDLADAPEAAAALVEEGAARAIVTDGSRPAADATASRIELIRPPDVPVLRVLGAGDALMAAHIAAEARGAQRQEALFAAIAAASDHVAGRP